MKTTVFKLPVFSFRKISNPKDEEGIGNYIMVANIKDLPPEISEWRQTNVRDPRLGSVVAKKIGDTLKDDPDSFFFKNRGVTLLAKSVNFDNKTNIVEIEMVDKQYHGLLDGGHTFQVIMNFLEGVPKEKLEDTNAFLKIEVLEGIKDYETIVGIVEARNTSTQVKEQSIEELRKRYEEIKKIIENHLYAERVAYKEYELLEDGTPKDIDIKELLSYLICFDVEEFNDEKHPILAYSTKSAVLDHFKNERERLAKYIPLLPKILELRDSIYLGLPEAYNSAGGRFGHLTGVIEVSGRRMGNVILPFTQRESTYRIPNGFIYPVLAAFRNLIEIKNGRCAWKADPIVFYEDLKAELATRVGEQARELRNPNKLGKDNATWGRCYDLVKMKVLEKNL
jgi:hypothetical protein